ncbi:MAG: hydantoinase/oxoprolinase family protein, partial [Hyphomicrobiales bacterium]
SGSAEVLPEMREYERFNTTALNGYIGPVTAGYLETLSGKLAARGYGGQVFIMISSGGIVTAERAARFPVQTVLSGPAGGVAAARHFGALLGLENLITYDMGGTSTDVCLIKDLRAPVTTDQYIEDYPVRTPQIDIHTVGAGGGSIAWVDSGDILSVGPKSAGAMPGPACYGRGGEEPTVTDANLVLGRLSGELKLAGSLALDGQAAERAVGRIAGHFLDLDIDAAAEGIVRIAVARMAGAIKEISVSRGFDPRDFVLVAYGGAGPLHAALIAEEFDMEHVLVPPSPGNFSAFGALISDVRHEHVQTHVAELGALDAESVEDRFAAMERDARAQMASEGMAQERITTVRACGMRYIGQSWDLIVPLPDRIDDVTVLAERFHEVHERRFGYAMEGGAEIVSFRVSVTGAVEKPALPDWPDAGTASGALTGERTVGFSGTAHTVPVYDRTMLPRSAEIAGPAIVEEMGAVTVVPPAWRAQVGRYGELHLKRVAS